MKTKTIVRVFAILLAIMMMSSLLVACNGDKDKKLTDFFYVFPHK